MKKYIILLLPFILSLLFTIINFFGNKIPLLWILSPIWISIIFFIILIIILIFIQVIKEINKINKKEERKNRVRKIISNRNSYKRKFK